ncbi:MAG: hypothetical protein ACREPM_23025 [Gemmatimonadaceae bacterium]
MRLRLSCALIALVVALGACDAPPVEWSDPVPASGQPDGRLSIDAAGRPRFADEPGAATVSAPKASGLCTTSLRLVRGSRHLFAAWWSVRPDSSAVLYSASSADSGATWGTPAAVDTSDVSSRGCNRPSPSLATVGDDLHTAYSMSAPEGTGVFFAHFMGSMLHSPVAVIYGERLVATAIAAEGDHVAVAYEEPNGTRQQVDVALSTTQGHLFDWHTTASRDIDAASAPSVALAGKTLAVAWTTRRQADTVSTRVVRVGHLR